MMMSTEKNFINFHVLISHSPSCLNRDDQNMQKRAVFGGVERIRISSQSLKRAMRKPPENCYDYWGDVFGKPSVRTRNPIKIIDLFSAELASEFSKEVVQRAARLFLKTTTEEDEVNEDNVDEIEPSNDRESNKKIAVAPWVITEIKELCKIVAAVKLTDEEMEKAKEKCTKQKGKRKLPVEVFEENALIKKIIKAAELHRATIVAALGQAIDVALWGRMATSGLMTSVDGSLAVAHAITTHAAQADTDWFTAVDDLIQGSDETGAGHLDTQEFSSGVFYRYASLNIAQLQKNLCGATRARALEIAKHVFHMLCTVIPSAKQQSFAAHNPADFAFVTFDDQPISLANAFEEPVQPAKKGGYLDTSIEAISHYFAKIKTIYGLGDISAGFSITQPNGPKDTPAFEQFQSLVSVENWIAADGKTPEKE
jgi:CRISPR system Cascade subunit CasC